MGMNYTAKRMDKFMNTNYLKESNLTILGKEIRAPS